MSFWERSDSTLSDEALRDLHAITITPKDALDYAYPYLDYMGYVQPEIGAQIGTGTFNRIFPFTDFALTTTRLVGRFNIHSSLSTASIHLEGWTSDQAIARGIQTPKLLHVDTTRLHCPYPFQLIEWSDTDPLRGLSDEMTQNILSDLGRELAKLHASPIGDRFGRVGIGTVPEWDMFVFDSFGEHVEYCGDKSLITRDQMAAITDVASSLPHIELESASLLHGDLSYDNIRVKDNRFAALIDWEDAVLGDHVFELSGLATFHPESRHAAFLDSYYGGTERPAEFGRRFWTYYLRIVLAKAVHRHRFGYETPTRVDGVLHPDDRISLALSRLKDLS